MKKLLTLSALSLLMLTACGKEAPAEAAETFVKEMLEGDAGKAVSLIYIPPQQRNEMSDAMTQQMLTTMFSTIQAEVKKQGGVGKIKIGEVVYNNDKTQADVQLTIERKDGKTDTQTLKTIKDDGNWKIAF